MLKQGDWEAIQKFRKSRSSNFSRMRNADGKVLFAHERAEGLAQHLETVQWAVRPDTIPSDKPAIFSFPDLDSTDFASRMCESR